MSILEPVIVPLLVFLVVTLIMFLVLRHVVCWYWKINRIVALLESINTRLGGELPDRGSSKT